VLLAAAVGTFAALATAADARASRQDDAKRTPADERRVPPALPRPKERAAGEAARAKGNPRADLDLASRLAQAERYDEAIAVLEALTADYPHVDAAADLLATCYLKAGRPRDAAALLEGMVAKDPDRYSSVRDLGLAYLDMGDKELAVASWRRLIRTDPRYGGHYGVVAKLMQEAGLYDEAIETYREGMAVPEYREGYARALVQLERSRGREDAAFREALLLTGDRGGPVELDFRREAIEIFGEAKNPARLLAIADSLAEARGSGGGRQRYLRVVFLANAGRFAEANAALFATGAGALAEEDFYSLLQYWESARLVRRDDRLDAFYRGALEGFVRDHGESFLAPSVLLMLAAERRDSARRAEAPAARLFEEALENADRARRHRLGAPYRERAAVFRARILLDDLHRPEEALAALDDAPSRAGVLAKEAAELRMRALLSSADRAAAERGLGALAAARDTNLAVLGRYGLARLLFLRGRYEEAVSALSAVAERNPESAWANDALETAIAVKESMTEDKRALELYREAAVASDRGEYERSLDSLGALEERFPSSVLVPRERFMRGDLEAALGRVDRSRAEFARLAESFPLHELAPRALERVADLAAARSPAEALAQYGVVIERYPDYPFLERVREKYVALGKSTPAARAPAAKAPASGDGAPAAPAEKKGKR